ncbi:MAG: hypothetical protein NC320_00955 [Clostridium sp.]|nr:hypothetical protein [Clostridium sp.]
MSKCKNCYHNKVCSLARTYESENHLIGYQELIEKCENFKNKDLILELPCKVGDTLYVILNKSEKFGGYYIKRERIVEISTAGRIWTNDCYYDNDDIGKMVFLSREEAEKALERCENGKY